MLTPKKIIFIFILTTIATPQLVFGVNDANDNNTEGVSQNTTISLTINNKIKEYITPKEMRSFIQGIPYLAYNPEYSSEIEKTDICLDKTKPCLLTSSIRQSMTVEHKEKTSLNEHIIRNFVEDLARKLDVDPVNAMLRFNEETGKVEEIMPHTDGVKVNIDKTTQKIADILKNNPKPSPQEVEIVYETHKAKVTSQNAKELGIKELIGKGVSNFAGSTKSRIHNITTAAKKFDGLTIAPGEEFSFTSILGPVDGEHGYKEELVIKDNETKPEFGGGICQVSTTVFRGAIFSGLKITKRRNHSYPVHYYTPTGFDATVYVPNPDLRFINNTPGYILLNMEMNGNELVFKYFGTDDGRTVVMDGPHVTDRQPNGAMKTYFTQTVTDKEGKIILDDTFKSNYKSPNDYPHPGDVAKLTSKPDNWSKKQWADYKRQNGL
jgi:vancomycin resistance protein YoaR